VNDQNVEFHTMRQVSLRLLPFLILLYNFCWLDRSNVSIAALQMNQELKFSSAAFGFGAGIYFLSYALFEVPSNLILARVGARLWFARIAVTWGIIACAMMWVQTPIQFYALRFLLGVAEAGFFPGVIYYLGLWFPAAYRARASSCFMIGIPMSQALGASIGGALLGLDGVGHLSGWQWLFLIEGLPSVLIGVAVLVCIKDRPEQAQWLSAPRREWISYRLAQEQQQSHSAHTSPLRVIGSPLAWVLIVPYFALCTVAYAITFWGPTLVHDALGTSNTITGLVIGGMYLFAALVYPLSGMFSDQWGDRCGLAAVGLGLYCAGSVGVALLPHSPLRVAALAVAVIGNPVFMSSFWCLPTTFLKGTAAAAGIALISSVGTTGGFFGPTIVGFLKQSTGGDTGAFFGLAALALIGGLVLLGLRQLAVFRPTPRLMDAVPEMQRT
jgi:ACS family tartrate transporter-like MFS transporter